MPPLGVGLAVLLLTLPLWSYSAHREARAEHGQNDSAELDQDGLVAAIQNLVR